MANSRFLTPERGCIHVYCDGCKSYRLNVRRNEADPPDAMVRVVKCNLKARRPEAFYGESGEYVRVQ
jgi:hypothetical protein